MDETQTEPRTKTLANGAVYDLDKKRIVSGALLTSDRARELVQIRIEKKQERLMMGAAKVLEHIGGWETPTDMDVVEAIGEAVMEKALDVDAKGQIDAAKFILTEAGLSSASRRDHESAQPNVIAAPPEALMQLVEMIEARQAAAVERSRAIDAVATDTRNEIQDKDEVTYE